MLQSNFIWDLPICTLTLVLKTGQVLGHSTAPIIISSL